MMESAMGIKVCAWKLWLLLHVTAWALHPCSSTQIHEEEILAPSAATYAQRPTGDDVSGKRWETFKLWEEYRRRKYFYVHNETLIAMARADAYAARSGGTSTRPSGTFPDIPPSEDGCNILRATRALSFFSSGTFSRGDFGFDDMQIFAIDSCADQRNVYLRYEPLEFCSQRWVKPEKPDILIRENLDPLARSFNVLVKIFTSQKVRLRGFEVLADGVYFPATGKMHLVGCSWPIPDWHEYSMNSTPPMADHFVVSESNEWMNIPVAAPAVSFPFQEAWIDPDIRHEPPLNSSTPKDCAIEVTVQYPPLHCRWNRDRAVKYSIHSKREKDDPLYFEPIERSIFSPYHGCHYWNHFDTFKVQQRLETWGRIVLLVLGLVCVALQIEHGRSNEESLPFVSLAMLGIQLANHVSQTSIFKDLRIGRYRSEYGTDRLSFSQDKSRSIESVSAFEYYGLMAWSVHVPYQAMAMVAIFMYVWIFHRVSDRRRIMRLRVLKKRPGAKEPPSDWRVMYATVAFFSLLCLLGFLALEADQGGHIRRALTGMTARKDARWARRAAHKASEDPTLAPYPFVSWLSYLRWQAHWGFINKLTGLVVSFFLVPQLLGNVRWEVQGRPLSAWFYVGIPFLQSLPYVADIAKHFELLPIFSFWDPYIDLIYGLYENPTPWWQIGVVVCSALQVLAVHSQF
jgi:hypothetical protein